MKEAFAAFPPVGATLSRVSSSDSVSLAADGYTSAGASSTAFRCGQEVIIDLRGLTTREKVLKINNIHMARLPSFDNTAFKTGKFGIYQVTDMHLVTTSPIVVETDVADVGVAPAHSPQIQVQLAAAGFGGSRYATNNGYTLPTPGIVPGDSGATNLPFFNVDPNMIVFCQTDVLTTNVTSDPFLATLLRPVDSSVYGMGNLAALESLHCYRFIFGTWTVGTATDCFIQALIGASIIQMNTNVVEPAAIERFQIMDQNFNTTNPLVE